MDKDSLPSAFYIKCDYCKKFFRITRSAYLSGKHHFCCKECYAKYLSERPKKHYIRKTDNRVSPTVGHKKGSNTRKYCTYTVYDNRTDKPVIVDGTAEQAAKAMNISVNSFYAAIGRAQSGAVKRWWIERNYLEGSEVYT